jgi:hypothetical protein
MKLTSIFIIAMAFLAGCSKDGAQGPAGANGSNGLNGTTGATGAQGTPGTNGTNGTANIKTNIYAVATSDWTTITAGSTYEVGFSETYITNADSDGVEVSLSTNATGPWIALPLTNFFSVGDQMIFQYENGQADVYYLFTSAPTTTIYYKVTVIPPSATLKKNITGTGPLAN